MTLDEIKEFLGNDWKETDGLIRSSLRSDIDLLNTTNEAILEHSGKQLRPIVSLLVARACGNGKANEDSVRCAAASELLHNATLLHDDVADSSAERRGAPTPVWHLSDIEGAGEEQLLTVQNTLNRMKAAKNLGKSVTYKWGYSNLSFDLWMILHKMNCNAEMNGVDGYLVYLNKAFGTQFDSMKKYKEEANFRYCLGKLTFQEVLTALSRAKTITQRNERDGYPVMRFKGYCYYIHNPSLDLHQPIEAILKDCNLL